MDELVDILHPSGESTGKTAFKSEAHRRGLYHRCFHCWISDPEKGLLFVQRRAQRKETWPGRLDTTAAGHLAAGETALDGLRELEEELGLKPDPERLVRLGTRRVEQDIPAGTDREFHDVFLLLQSLNPNMVKLQREEVGALLGLRLSGVERLHAGETAGAEQWTAEGAVSETEVRLEEFVPNEDSYVLTVARAVAAHLSGEPVEQTFRPF